MKQSVNTYHTILIVALLLVFVKLANAQTDTLNNETRTIQFNVSALLNSRVISTFTNNKLITWNKGIDGEWSGLATRSAADKMGSKTILALPDNGVFAASNYHPTVTLNFSNTNATENQVRFTPKNTNDSYSFPVAENYYSNLSLFFMSAFGTSKLDVIITYNDSSTETKAFSVEDWGLTIDENATKYLLATNMGKWSDKNIEMEPDKHYLMGINVQPKPNKKVTKITIHKKASETTLSFWGATGYGASSSTWTVFANSSKISYEGRTVETSIGSVLEGYPGIITRVNFTGTSLSMIANTSSNELYLDASIDGEPPTFLKVPYGESKVSLAKDLKANEHTITIHKRIESCVGVMEVKSFTVSGNFNPANPLPLRKLLFMGDSFTTGQATTVEDGGFIDPSKAMRQNARLSYARLLADRLNAQCHIIAYAGRGVVRDWQGLNNIRCAPEYYEYALPDDTIFWNHTNYVPDAICICLGNNDFGIGIPDQVQYIKAYVEFLRKVRRDAPNAHIFLITSPSLVDEPGKLPLRSVQKAYLDEIAKLLNDNKCRVLQINHYPGVPGDWHPSGTAHRAIADELEPNLRKALKW